ncbi:unnamed protein product [Cuscuta campestris]|uniref:Uncharacterized protein n=1 Tax=Cuscuta campestris TaxID=132261 RepID=A0A484NB05_9ASTE|nr:unnamed protein product [Cuscuta campestris]
MASLNLSFPPATTPRRRARTTAAATKKSVGSRQEKSLLDWILGYLQKEDQLLETDPILNKVEKKRGGTAGGTAGGRRNSVALPKQKSKPNGDGFGGFGGLFSKKPK